MSKQLNEIIELIKTCPLFHPGLSDEIISKLAKQVKKIKLKAKSVLFEQGTPSDEVYLLVSGQLRSFVNDTNHIRKEIGVIYPFETIGELGTLLKEKRSLTVIADSDAELIMLPKHVFMKLCKENSLFTLNMMQIVAARTIKTINLFSSENKLNFRVFLPATKDTPITIFYDFLKKTIEEGGTKFISPDEELMAVVNEAIRANHVGQRVCLILDEFNESLMSLFEQQHTKFYLIVNHEQRGTSEAIKKILAFIKEKKLHLELCLLHPNNSSSPEYATYWANKTSFKLFHHIRLYNNPDYKRIGRFLTDQAVGLVLNGGGVRCFAHIGVIKALLEENIPIDIIGGTSGGAIIAAAYAYSQDYDRCIEMFTEITQALHASVSIRNITWPLVSLFSGYPGIKVTRKLFGKAHIENLWIPYFCVSCDMSRNAEFIHQRGRLVIALQSTSTIPGAWPPALIHGHLHYDGGILNNLPVDVMQKIIGPKSTIIASRVSRMYQNNASYSFPHVLKLKTALLYKAGLSRRNYRFPDFMESFLNALLVSSSHTEVQNSDLADVLIQPEVSDFGTFKMKKNITKEILIDKGYQAAKSACQRLDLRF